MPPSPSSTRSASCQAAGVDLEPPGTARPWPPRSLKRSRRHSRRSRSGLRRGSPRARPGPGCYFAAVGCQPGRPTPSVFHQFRHDAVQVVRFDLRLAIVGLVMPGLSRTSARAWLARVLPPRRPRGRPARRSRRRVVAPPPLALAGATGHDDRPRRVRHSAASSLVTSTFSSLNRRSMSFTVLSTSCQLVHLRGQGLRRIRV